MAAALPVWPWTCWPLKSVYFSIIQSIQITNWSFEMLEFLFMKWVKWLNGLQLLIDWDKSLLILKPLVLQNWTLLTILLNLLSLESLNMFLLTMQRNLIDEFIMIDHSPLIIQPFLDFEIVLGVLFKEPINKWKRLQKVSLLCPFCLIIPFGGFDVSSLLDS